MRPGGGRVSRRSLLAGGAAGLVAGVAGASGLHRAASAADAGSGAAAVRDGARTMPFHGRHQAGIVDPPPPAAVFAAFDVIAPGPPDLADVFRTLTTRARFLTAGGAPAIVNNEQPEDDSGVLGPTVPADALTVTVSVGASLVDERYGLAARRRARAALRQPPRHVPARVA